jgi:hypothetical protein
LANEIAVGERIRMFFRQLLGSRLTEHMEEELHRLRGDYETRLRERESYIADLKAMIQEQKAKIAEYELVLIPLTSGNILGGRKPPNVSMEPIVETGTWAAEKANYYKQQEEEALKEQSNAGIEGRAETRQ